MSSLPSFDTENEPKIARSVEKFFKDYKVMELLRRCGLRKSKGIPLWSILSYIFSNVFRNRSMYMQQKSGKCTAGFSKNTYYRFMQNPHINWLRLTILLAERIVNGHLKDLTSDQRADCFVFDDSLYSRTGYKKTELAAKVFDHVSMTYKKGFRMMTMGWTDGSSFVPIASSLLSSKNDQNVIGTTKKIDKRTIKGDHVVIQLLDQALKAGLTAKYVMFDTWFSNPHQIVQISQRGLNVIAMVKKSSKITYEFEEKRMNVKQIFNACKKRRGRSRYLLSVPVKVGDPAKDGAQIDARIVCVRNLPTAKTGSLLFARTWRSMKMRSSEFTAKDGTSRSSSRPARVSWSLALNTMACHMMHWLPIQLSSFCATCSCQLRSEMMKMIGQ